MRKIILSICLLFSTSLYAADVKTEAQNMVNRMQKGLGTGMSKDENKRQELAKEIDTLRSSSNASVKTIGQNMSYVSGDQNTDNLSMYNAKEGYVQKQFKETKTKKEIDPNTNEVIEKTEDRFIGRDFTCNIPKIIANLEFDANNHNGFTLTITDKRKGVLNDYNRRFKIDHIIGICNEGFTLCEGIPADEYGTLAPQYSTQNNTLSINAKLCGVPNSIDDYRKNFENMKLLKGVPFNSCENNKNDESSYCNFEMARKVHEVKETSEKSQGNNPIDYRLREEIKQFGCYPDNRKVCMNWGLQFAETPRQDYNETDNTQVSQENLLFNRFAWKIQTGGKCEALQNYVMKEHLITPVRQDDMSIIADNSTSDIEKKYKFKTKPTPKKDENGNVVKDENGKIVLEDTKVMLLNLNGKEIEADTIQPDTFDSVLFTAYDKGKIVNTITNSLISGYGLSISPVILKDGVSVSDADNILNIKDYEPYNAIEAETKSKNTIHFIVLEQGSCTSSSNRHMSREEQQKMMQTKNKDENTTASFGASAYAPQNYTAQDVEKIYHDNKQNGTGINKAGLDLLQKENKNEMFDVLTGKMKDDVSAKSKSFGDNATQTNTLVFDNASLEKLNIDNYTLENVTKELYEEAMINAVCPAPKCKVQIVKTKVVNKNAAEGDRRKVKQSSTENYITSGGGASHETGDEKHGRQVKAINKANDNISDADFEGAPERIYEEESVYIRECVLLLEDRNDDGELIAGSASYKYDKLLQNPTDDFYCPIYDDEMDLNNEKITREMLYGNLESESDKSNKEKKIAKNDYGSPVNDDPEQAAGTRILIPCSCGGKIAEAEQVQAIKDTMLAATLGLAMKASMCGKTSEDELDRIANDRQKNEAEAKQNYSNQYENETYIP